MLPAILLITSVKKSSGPLLYLGRSQSLDLYYQIIEVPEDNSAYDIRIRFMSFRAGPSTPLKQTRNSNRPRLSKVPEIAATSLNTSSFPGARSAVNSSIFDVGDSLGHGFFASGDFLGHQKIPQVYVSVTSGRILTCLLEYDGHSVRQMLRIGSGRVRTWPVQIARDLYEVKAKYYLEETLAVRRVMAEGKPHPSVELTISGSQIMKWWLAHKTPYSIEGL